MEWMMELGQVELEVDLPNGETVSITASPLQASVIWLFQEKGIFENERVASHR